MGDFDPYYRLKLLERRVCLLEKKEEIEQLCSLIEVVDFIEDIDIVYKTCNRFIVVLVDSSNNGDMSLYMDINGTLKFIQTIA